MPIIKNRLPIIGLCSGVILLSACGGYPISGAEINDLLPTLNQINCPNIDGTYEPDKEGFFLGSLAEVAFPTSATRIDAGLVRKNANKERKFSHDTPVVELKRINSYSIEATFYKPKPEKKFLTSIYSYKKTEGEINSSAGCYKDALVARRIYDFGGYKFTRPSRHSKETQFRRLKNGDLEVTIVGNHWYHNRPRQTVTEVKVFKQFQAVP